MALDMTRVAYGAASLEDMRGWFVTRGGGLPHHRLPAQTPPDLAENESALPLPLASELAKLGLV